MKPLCHVPVVPCSIFHSILSDASDEFKALKASFVFYCKYRTHKDEIKTLGRVHVKETIYQLKQVDARVTERGKS